MGKGRYRTTEAARRYRAVVTDSEAARLSLSLVSTFVMAGMEPLRLVIHHDDGTWDFLCNTTADARYLTTIHTDEVFAKFGLDLQSLRTLPPGHLAEREGRGDEWHVEPYVEQD